MTSRSSSVAQLLLTFLALLCAFSVHAQSGRRQSKPPQVAPVPTPTPEPTPKPKEETKTDVGFIVGIDQNDSFSYYPLSYYTTVLNACADRLKRGSSAKVTTSEHMNRGEAIRAAKSEKTTYVVWLRFYALNMNNQSTRDADIELEYTVFTPVTAKIATSGRSYQNARRAGPVVVGPPGGSTSILYREALLKRTAEDAADRILKALHLAVGERPAFPSSVRLLHTSDR
jgi:hypothetical protein